MNIFLYLINGIKFAILWVIVPGILLGIFFYSRSILKQNSNEQNKISMNAGFWCGLVLFVIFIVYTMRLVQLPDFSQTKTLDFNLLGVIIGIIIGFSLLILLRLTLKYTPISSFIILILTFSSLSALYSYFFIQTFNNIIISSTLGLVLGALLYIMIIPQSISEVLRR